jgi:oxygen-dependent protoporphyrinogen oxidase
MVLLEAGERLGGNIRTEREGDFLLDGPDGFVVSRPHALELCEKLGLADRLIETIPENRRVYVVRRRELVPLPDHLMLGVPVRLMPALRSPLFSWKAKARLLSELLVPPFVHLPDADFSIGDFLERRLGKEVVEIAVEPLLGGVYAGDARRLSLPATFPQLVEAASRSGSLLRGMREKSPSKRSTVRPSPFRALRGGTGELITALGRRMDGATVRCGAPTSAVQRTANGRLEVQLASGEKLDADRVVVGLPAHAAARTVERLDPILSAELAAIPYISAAVVYLGYRREQVRHPLDASGFLVPKTEGLKIMGTTFMSSKWEGRAPAGHVLLRTFVGGAYAEGLTDLADDALVSIVLHELEPLLGIEGAPVVSRIFRYPKSSPQPVVGHRARVERIRGLLASHPGLLLIGNAYEGVGMPDTIRVASTAAEELIATL